VKNHFQLITSLLAHETRDADDDAANLARRMVARLKTLAAVYDRMGQADIGGRISARAFLEDVVAPYRTSRVSVRVLAPEALTLPPDLAGPLGMLVNEAVNNSYKHAFPGGDGRIDVALLPGPPRRLELKVADDGVGFSGPVRPGSQGLQLMRILAGQMDGEVEISNRAEGGAQVTADLPASLSRG
jgi:two-component sensor histidine kinase